MTSVTKHFFFSQPAALPPIDNIDQLFVDIVQRVQSQGWRCNGNDMKWHTFRIENTRENIKIVIRNQLISTDFPKSRCFYHVYPESNYASQATTENHIPIV